MNKEFFNQAAIASTQTNVVLRNTYMLLSLTLLFSAVMAGVSMATGAGFINVFLILLGYIGLPMLIQANRNSGLGIVFTFAYTGFVGWTLGPILNQYVNAFSNGAELIMMALGSTGLIFLGLSALAMNPNKDFTNWGSFLGIGALVAMVAMIANIFLHLPGLQLAVSLAFALISGGFIMLQTNAIVRGGETNYVLATVNLYASIVNIFLTLLQLLGMFGGNNRD